jgi:hypothetical protein
MKLNQLALATVALCAASQSFAADTYQYLTGASASSINVMKAAKNLCLATSATNTFKIYKTDTTTNSLGNNFTGVCSTSAGAASNILGTSVNAIAMNVKGGSLSAITGQNTGSVDYNAANNTFVTNYASGCTLTAGTEALSTTNFSGMSLYVCPSAAKPGTLVPSVGGFMDVEGTVFDSEAYADDLQNGAFQLAGFSQAFGVAVNTKLWNALQTAQFTAGDTCLTTTDTTIKYSAKCQPSIGKAQIASLINNDTGNAAKTSGGKFLVGGTADATKITYCARPQTSGTQQAAQLYFLNYGGNGSNLGGNEVIVNVPLTVGSTYAAASNAGSSDVKACMNASGANDGYKFGMISLENNPLAGSDTYRFVKVGGAAGAEGTSASDSNTTTAISGAYDYVFETVAYCKVNGAQGTCPSFIQSILNNKSVALPAGSSTAGLFLTGLEGTFGRGAGGVPNSAAPYITR